MLLLFKFDIPVNFRKTALAKYCLCSLLGLLFLTPLRAQFIFTSTHAINERKAQLDLRERTFLKDSIPFAGIRVVDGRFDTTMIGFIYRQMLALWGPGDRPLSLQQFVEEQYQTLCTPGDDSLVLFLDKLYIHENPNPDDHFRDGWVITCKLYYGKNNNYDFLTRASIYDNPVNPGSVKRVDASGKKYSDVTFWDNYLLDAFDEVIKKAATCYRAKCGTTHYCVNLQSLADSAIEKRKIPVLQTDSLKPGFYHDFNEFKNNAPGFTYTSKESLEKLLKIMHYTREKQTSDEAMPDTMYWGFCDGHSVFVRCKFNFFQIERHDATWYVTATLDYMRKSSGKDLLNALTGIAVLGVGVLAGTLDMDAFRIFNNSGVPFIPVRLGDDVNLGLQLDWNTGKIVF